MLHPYFIRFYLSAAIALPPVSVLGFAGQAQAVEETATPTRTPMHQFQNGQEQVETSDRPLGLTISPGIEERGFAAAFSHGNATPFKTHASGTAKPLVSPFGIAAVNLAEPGESAAAMAATRKNPAATMPSPRSENRLSQAGADAAPATPPASPDVPSPATTEDNGDEVFSPLPGSEAEPPASSEEESPEPSGLEETLTPPLDAPAGPSEGDAIPIPEERVLDDLEYLDAYPNPLLTPTTPEEVEIIGTQPLTLEEAIEISFRNNPDLRVSLLELEQSRAALREAQADLYPRVSVSGNLQGQNTTTGGGGSLVPDADGGFTFETDSGEELGVGLSAQLDVVYSLYTSGRRDANIQAAEEQIRINELEVERRREELRINTSNEYYDLQEAIEAIRISQAFLDEAERNLRDTTLREEVGVGTRFDVLQAQVQVANARQDLVNSERARQVAQRVLSRRLNVPATISITTVPVEVAGAWPLELEESIVLAFQNRAELEQQLTQRDLNEQLRRLELAALGPQVDLFANYNVSDTFTQEGGLEDGYQFGARVSWTLFEGGAAAARAQQRELEAEIADENYDETLNAVRLEVEDAYFNLQSNLTNIDTARLAVQQAQEALDLAILRFDAGVGTQLEILNAQSELTDAEVNLVQAVVGYNRSLAALERAVSNIPEPYYEELPY